MVGCCGTDGKVGSTGPELNTITSGGDVRSGVRGAGAGAVSAVCEVDLGADVVDFEARTAEDSTAW